MSGTILTETSGFTPVIDALAAEIGLIPAAVYGVVWRHCQMRDGICRASLQTLADKLGCDRSTLKRHLKTLCEAGYVEDTTPDAKHTPHVYRDTGRVKIRALIAVGAEVGQSAPPDAARWGREHDQGGAECPTGGAESMTKVGQSVPQGDYQETMEETRQDTPAAIAAENSPASLENQPDLPAICPDCGKPHATDGTNHVRDCCTCAGEAALDEVFGKRERSSLGELRSGHWLQHTGGDTATPAQAGGAASIAEAIADRIVVQHNQVPDGLAALGTKQRRAWVKMIQGVLDQYDPITEAQARLVGDAWCVYNSFRRGPANPYHSSMPGDVGPLVARVLAGTLTAERLRAEAANGAKKRNMAPGRPQPKPRTPEEEVRIRAALEEHAK